MVAPRATVSIANVTTKGGRENRVITQPLKIPIAKPMSRAAKIPPKVVKPINKSKDSRAMPFVNNPAQTAEVKAKTEPTERSIPAVSTTNVIPTEIHTLTDIWRNTFQRLLAVRNLSDNKLIARQSTKSAINDCDFFNNSLFIYIERIV